MQRAWNKQRVTAGFLLGLTLFLTGCGSSGGGMKVGGGNGGAPTTSPSTRTATLAKFDVDVQTGKVKITTIDDKPSPSRAVLTGGAVSFASSELLNVGGDSGKRVLNLTITNNTREGPLTSARLIIGNLSNTVKTDFPA